MKIAVIKIGGKQYQVAEKDKIKIEKLPAEEGQEVVFDEVLMIADGDDVQIGKPMLKAKVTGKVTKVARTKKIIVVKYKSKTRYKKTQGHRQNYSEVEILKIA